MHFVASSSYLDLKTETRQPADIAGRQKMFRLGESSFKRDADLHEISSFNKYSFDNP